MTEPTAPAMITLPRSLFRVIALLLLAHLLDSWHLPPLALTARIVASVCMISYLYSTWRWSRYAARKIKKITGEDA